MIGADADRGDLVVPPVAGERCDCGGLLFEILVHLDGHVEIIQGRVFFYLLTQPPMVACKMESSV